VLIQCLKQTGNLQNGCFSANAAGLAKMADGFFADSDAARLKMADGFFSATAAGRSKVENLFVQSGHFDNGTIDVAKLAYQPATDLGRPATGHLRNIAPNANDLVTITVNGAAVIYEWDGAGANVNVARGGGAPAEATRLQIAIAANQGAVLASNVHAVDTTCIDMRVLTAGQTLALATTNAARVAFQDNGEELAAQDRSIWQFRRIVTAEDVLRTRVLIDTGLTNIRGYVVRIITSAALNTEILYSGIITITGGVINMDNTGMVDLALNQIIALEVQGD